LHEVFPWDLVVDYGFCLRTILGSVLERRLQWCLACIAVQACILLPRLIFLDLPVYLLPAVANANLKTPNPRGTWQLPTAASTHQIICIAGLEKAYYSSFTHALSFYTRSIIEAAEETEIEVPKVLPFRLMAILILLCRYSSLMRKSVVK
jgi:hypothetical protein